MVGGYHIYYAYSMHEDTFYKKKNIFAFPLGTHLHKQTFMVTNDEMDTLIFCNFSTIYEDPMKINVSYLLQPLQYMQVKY